MPERLDLWRWVKRESRSTVKSPWKLWLFCIQFRSLVSPTRSNKKLGWKSAAQPVSCCCFYFFKKALQEMPCHQQRWRKDMQEAQYRISLQEQGVVSWANVVDGVASLQRWWEVVAMDPECCCRWEKLWSKWRRRHDAAGNGTGWLAAFFQPILLAQAANGDTMWRWVTLAAVAMCLVAVDL